MSRTNRNIPHFISNPSQKARNGRTLVVDRYRRGLIHHEISMELRNGHPDKWNVVWNQNSRKKAKKRASRQRRLESKFILISSS